MSLLKNENDWFLTPQDLGKPLSTAALEFIAHSSEFDPYRKATIPVQLYLAHATGVYKYAFRHIKAIKRYVTKEWYAAMKRAILIAAEYHDLGKLDDQAQAVLRGLKDTKMINHVDAGVAYCLSVYESKDQLEWLLAAILIHSHHIGLLNQEDLVNEAVNLLTVTQKPTKLIRDNKHLCTDYGLGRYRVATRVNKNLHVYLKRHGEALNGFQRQPAQKIDQCAVRQIMKNVVAIRIMASILVDADHEDTSRHYGQPYVTRDAHESLHAKDRCEMVQDHIRAHFGNRTSKRDQMRSRFLKVCDREGRKITSGFTLVDAPVGMAKTFGEVILAMRMAKRHHKRAVNFVLPYIALIDQSAEVYKNAVALNEKDAKWNINVIHSVVTTESLWHRRYMRGFNAPINLTTAVNWINIFMSNHSSVFKNAHRLVGSVIVIDEFDRIADSVFWPAMEYFMQILVKDFGCMFVFASGTPTRYWDIDRLARAYPDCNIVSDLHEVVGNRFYKQMMDLELSRVETVSWLDKDVGFDDVSEEINRLAGSVFIIMRTRKRAVRMFYHLRDHTNRKIYLRFAASAPVDRKRQLEEIKKDIAEGSDIVLVSTQGSDIGLDLSFRHGFKESSDFNSILQIRGRINRNCEWTDSMLFIFNLSEKVVKRYDLHDNYPLRSRGKLVEEELAVLKRMSPRDCTLMAEKEVGLLKPKQILEMRSLVEAMKKCQHERLSDEFRLLKYPSICIITDRDVFDRILRNEQVSWNEVQESIVHMHCDEDGEDFMDKINRGLLVKIESPEDHGKKRKRVEQTNEDRFGGMYGWRGEYDKGDKGGLGIYLGWNK